MISKEKKQSILKDLADKLSRQQIVIFSDYSGLKVNQLGELRRQLKENGVDYQVAKKTLIDLALAKAGLNKVKAKELSGQIGLAFGYQDEVLPAKILYNFAQNNESLEMLAGLSDGQCLDSQALIKLAKLPSREELTAQFVGGLAAPLTGLINVLQGNLRKLTIIFKNLKPEA